MEQLLITLSKKLKRNDSIADPTKGFYEEPDMFYLVKINKGIINLGLIQLDEHAARKEATERNLSLAEFLEKGVQADADLLQYCKKNRVGYTGSKTNIPQKQQKSQLNLKKLEKTRWQNFIIKILKQKNDLIHLKEFTTHGA